MTWTAVQSAVQTAQFTGGGAGTTAATFGAPVAVGDVIIVQTPIGDVVSQAALAALAASMADNLGGGTPNVYTRLTTGQGSNLVDTGNIQGTAHFVCLVTQAGTPTLTLTPNGGSPQAFIAIQAVHFTGSGAASTMRASGGQTETNPGTGADAINSGSIGAQNGDLVCVMTNCAGNGVANAVLGSGFAAAAAINATIGAIMEFREATGATDGTFTDATTGGARTYMTCALAITPAVAPPVTASLPGGAAIVAALLGED